VVVLDIKRENFEATAGYRAEAGQRVLLFDPLAKDGRTARFNPLGHIDRDDPVAVLDELQRMSVMLFTGSDHADPFWSEAARTGFIGVGAVVAETPDRPFTLGEIYRQLTQGDPRLRFPALIEDRRRQGRPLSAGCVSALTDFCASSENTFASVRQSITSRMGLWLNPAVDAATSASDFDLRTVREGDLSLYLGASPDNLLRVAPSTPCCSSNLSISTAVRCLVGRIGRSSSCSMSSPAWDAPRCWRTPSPGSPATA